nr:hypothetical protein Iba_chr10eCG10730 [Ipomoea batatas]
MEAAMLFAACTVGKIERDVAGSYWSSSTAVITAGKNREEERRNAAAGVSSLPSTASREASSAVHHRDLARLPPCAAKTTAEGNVHHRRRKEKTPKVRASHSIAEPPPPSSSHNAVDEELALTPVCETVESFAEDCSLPLGITVICTRDSYFPTRLPSFTPTGPVLLTLLAALSEMELSSVPILNFETLDPVPGFVLVDAANFKDCPASSSTGESFVAAMLIGLLQLESLVELAPQEVHLSPLISGKRDVDLCTEFAGSGLGESESDDVLEDFDSNGESMGKDDLEFEANVDKNLEFDGLRESDEVGVESTVDTTNVLDDRCVKAIQSFGWYFSNCNKRIELFLCILIAIPPKSNVNPNMPWDTTDSSAPDMLVQLHIHSHISCTHGFLCKSPDFLDGFRCLLLECAAIIRNLYNIDNNGQLQV